MKFEKVSLSLLYLCILGKTKKVPQPPNTHAKEKVDLERDVI
jgi:hypothetical protein